MSPTSKGKVIYALKWLLPAGTAASTGNAARSPAGQCWHWENAKCATATPNYLSPDSTAPARRGEGQIIGRGHREHTKLSSTAHPRSTTQGRARGRRREQASQSGHQAGRHSEPLVCDSAATAIPPSCRWALSLPHSIDMLMYFTNFLDEISIKCLNIYRATSQDTSILDNDLPQHQE